jgi:predicted PurR-regulated permease PerM
MKLQWDKNYLKIAFYVVLTLVSTYILFKVVDSAAYVLTNAGEIGGDINRGIGYVFSVFSVLIIGFVIAYLLDPLVDFFQRRYDRLYDKEIQPLIHRRFQPMLRFRATLKAAKTRRVFKKRTAGTVLTYLIFFSAIGLLIFFIVSRIHIGGTTSADIPRDLISSVNKTANEFGDFVAGTQLTLENWGVSDEVADMVSNLFSAATDFVKGFSENIGPTLTSATTGTVDFFMGLVVAFYFLMDKEMIAARSTELCDTFLPKKIGRRVKNILGDVHVVFSGYIRGQMTDAAIIGVL